MTERAFTRLNNIPGPKSGGKQDIMKLRKFRITIETTNAAFDGNSDFEIARILHRTANAFEGVGTDSLNDINGNRVVTKEFFYLRGKRRTIR